MDILKVCFTSLGSLIVLFISTKLIGNKQISELTMFDYINSITIGSIGAEMATNVDIFHLSLTAIAVYTLVILLVSYVTQKSVKIRRILTGTSIILMENGKLYPKNFSKSKLDINEFLTQCRINGYFNLEEIDTAILEQNGKISILPNVSARPVNTKDLNLAVPQEKISVNVILDGSVMEDNLRRSGNDIEWLKHELEKQNITSISDVFLAVCDTENNKLTVYVKAQNEQNSDVFQ